MLLITLLWLLRGLGIKPVCIDEKYCPDYLLKSACNSWDKAVQWGEKYGFRNAQSTVIAPTGTIGLVDGL
jgi:ribonucleoside-diphosphate reductase alpha chain